jgi:hypothetical protein
MALTTTREKGATCCLLIVCNQRPLCQCPTIGPGKSRLSVFVRPDGTVSALKKAIQAQGSRGSAGNAQLLDPGRQVLFDPTEGHELQVTNDTLREIIEYEYILS